MSENEMDNRVSNSIIVANFLSAENIIVKEQRVDGSYINKLMLRCTLKGFERSSQIRISSNQINKIRLYSTVSGYEVKAQRELDLLNPYFVTGFTDALLKKVAGINQFSTKRSCSNNLSLVV
jgi:hypothetical protein